MNSCLGARKRIRLAEELPSPWSSRDTLGIGDERLPALSIPFTRWMRDSLQSHNSPVPLFPPPSPISLTSMRHASLHAAIHSVTTSCFRFLKSQGPVLGAQARQGSNWAPPIQGQLSDDSHQETCRHRLRPSCKTCTGKWSMCFGRHSESPTRLTHWLLYSFAGRHMWLMHGWEGLRLI